ncbi:MAG: acyl-CoA dehydrogenase family protein [Pseudomonadota bacterium]
MALVLNEEQSMLQNIAREFCASNAPIEQLRRLRDEGNACGFDEKTWSEMVKLGWAGINVPEGLGGSAFGYMGLGVVMRECGRSLVASPLFSTAVIGVTALTADRCPSVDEVLGQIVRGELLMALALEETPIHSPYDVGSTAQRMDDGFFEVSGKKTFVLDGHIADKLIVVARSDKELGQREGLTVVLVDGNDPRVNVTRTQMLDARNAANVEFTGARGTLIGEEGRGAELLDRILDAGRILLAAEMLGSVEACFEQTIEYLKVREQFGVPIGTFQALKHRAAEMFCEIELCKSVVMEALSVLDEPTEQLPVLASLAKCRLNDTFHRVSTEGIQMHGGIGMTDEHNIGFFLKRSRVCEQMFGSSAYHRDRFGSLNGY